MNPRAVLGAMVASLALATSPAWTAHQSASRTQQQTASAAANTSAATGTSASRPMPRGTKLMLRDGSFQLVREYHVEGDRVRYYSLDTSEWEVIPAALVDWDATKKEEAAEQKAEAAAIATAKHEEQERHPQILDVDASVEVAPGIFLPSGDGLFVFDGKSVNLVDQAQTESSIDKKRFLEKVLVPVPIISSRAIVSIQGAHAKLRLASGQPEFYLRTADQREPDVSLIEAKIRGDKREIANVDELFQQKSESARLLPLQRWQVAAGLYRFTLGKALAPGEYVIAERVPGEGMSLYVWDFGVDRGSKHAGDGGGVQGGGPPSLELRRAGWSFATLRAKASGRSPRSGQARGKGERRS